MIPLERDIGVVIQGITGREGAFHSRLMREYGTRVLAGVTPGKGGSEVERVPVYNSVKDATANHPGIKISVVFVPAPRCGEAVLEAIEGGVELIVTITEGIPQKDALWLIHYARCHGSAIIGPNCPGLISPPNRLKLGIMPAGAFKNGNVGIISRSGTLTYEVGDALRRNGIGVSVALGIGGDPIVGTTLSEAAALLQNNPRTDTIVVLGEIGGNMEEELAEKIESGMVTKPAVAFIAGLTAPQGKRLGHAGAILQSGSGSALDKIQALKSVGVLVANSPWQIPEIIIKN